MKTEKRCAGCQVTMPVVNFAKNCRTRDGFQAYCRTCHAIATAKAKVARAERGDKPRTWDMTSDRECRTCLQVKPIADFFVHSRREDGTSRPTHTCKECTCVRVSARRFTNYERILNSERKCHMKHIDQRRAASKKHGRMLKQKVYDKLGRRCVHCGFDDIRALQIDHINSDGRLDRRLPHTTFADGSTRYRTKGYTRYLTQVLNDTEGKYQILCSNCNWIKRAEIESERSGCPRKHLNTDIPLRSTLQRRKRLEK